jgi:hypothetical protein
MHWEGKSSERVSYQDHYQTIEAMRPMSKLANTTGKLHCTDRNLQNGWGTNSHSGPGFVSMSPDCERRHTIAAIEKAVRIQPLQLPLEVEPQLSLQQKVVKATKKETWDICNKHNP